MTSKSNSVLIKEQIAAVENHAYENGPLRVISFGSATEQKTRFIVNIPYCNSFLKWVITISENGPPDFIFPEGDEFFMHALSNGPAKSNENPILKILSLQKWQKEDNKGLLSVLLDLIKFYRVYQSQLVAEYPDDRVQFEYSAARNIEGTEFYVKSQENVNEVRFSLPLTVDLNALGPDYQEVISIKPRLYVVFKTISSNNLPEIKLQIPEPWRQLNIDLPVPAWTTEACLSTYIPAIQESIGTKVITFLSGLKKRKALFTALNNAFGTPTECDSIEFRKITFIFDYSTDKINFLLIVQMLGKYPEEQPIINLHLLSLSRGKIPQPRQYNSYPYSPRWPPEEFVKRLAAFLIPELNELKKITDE